MDFEKDGKDHNSHLLLFRKGNTRLMLDYISQYRFLFEELVKRDFKTKYKGTMLGAAWSVLSPLLQLLIMRLVFTHFFGTEIEHYTTFLFCGNIIFSYFSEATSTGMVSLVANAPIYSKVNVPKHIFVFSRNIQTAINFTMVLFVFFVLCIIDGVMPDWEWLWLIYPVILLAFFNTGIGMILSVGYIFFRDMQYLWSIFLQLLIYISAIFYDITTFPVSSQNLFFLNPVYLYIYYFREIVLNNTVPSFFIHVLMLSETITGMCLGLFLYKKYKSEFLYYI